MKVGLLADIHGNATALRAVLTAAASLSVSRLCVVGDLVGYYYEPAECDRLLRPWVTDWVRGNHEDLLALSEGDPASASALHAKYGSGLRVASQELSADTRKRMTAWPTTATVWLGERRVRLCHGAPWATDEYVYPDAPWSTWERMAADGEDLVVFGHTHYRVERQVGRTRIVNPGSVGQARDGSGGACWAVFDAETNTCELRVEHYDREEVVREARLRDPHLPYLVDVLYREAARP